MMLESAQESSEVAAISSGHGTVETTSEKKLGTAIYPAVSLMNHSCAPNAILRYHVVFQHHYCDLGLKNCVCVNLQICWQ